VPEPCGYYWEAVDYELAVDRGAAACMLAFCVLQDVWDGVSREEAASYIHTNSPLSAANPPSPTPQACNLPVLGWGLVLRRPRHRPRHRHKHTSSLSPCQPFAHALSDAGVHGQRNVKYDQSLVACPSQNLPLPVAALPGFGLAQIRQLRQLRVSRPVLPQAISTLPSEEWTALLQPPILPRSTCPHFQPPSL
jgi:hypothetical protein